MQGASLDTDLSDAQWAFLEPMLPWNFPPYTIGNGVSPRQGTSEHSGSQRDLTLRVLAASREVFTALKEFRARSRSREGFRRRIYNTGGAGPTSLRLRGKPRPSSYDNQHRICPGPSCRPPSRLRGFARLLHSIETVSREAAKPRRVREVGLQQRQQPSLLRALATRTPSVPVGSKVRVDPIVPGCLSPALQWVILFGARLRVFG